MRNRLHELMAAREEELVFLRRDMCSQVAVFGQPIFADEMEVRWWLWERRRRERSVVST
jgi:hypothetical protein